MEDEEVLLVADDEASEEPASENITDNVSLPIQEDEVEDNINVDTSVLPVRDVKFGVKSKLVLSTALLISVITLIIGFYLLNVTKKSLLKEMKFRAKIIAKNLAKNIPEILEDDTSRHQIILETSKIKDIEKIVVYNNDNNIIDHSDKKVWKRILLSKFDESVKKVTLQLSKDIQDLLNKKDFIQRETPVHIDVFMPIKFGNTKIGAINITFTKKNIINKIRKIQTSILIFIFVALILGIVSAYILATYIIKPIKKLAKGARVIGSGKLNYKIEVKTNDELGSLADEFNNMTTRLIQAQKSLVEKERFEEQLEIARNIQVNLLVDKFPVIDGIEMNAFYKAAKGVGGDYYDIIHIKEKKQIGAIIADVSGKGVPAALVMVMIRTVFHSTFKFVKETNEAIENINTGISGRLTGDKFATMFFFIYNYATGLMRYTNAAHSPLIVYRTKEERFIELDTEGIPVGVDVTAKFGTNSIHLIEGDVLVTFTDGITEAMNLKEEMFKSERLKDSIKRNCNLSAGEIVTNIIKEIDDFVGTAPQHDDMTLLVVKINKIGKMPQSINANIPSRKVISKNYLYFYMNPMDPYSLLLI